MSRIFTLLLLPLFIFSAQIQAHPGRTAADGCHYCRTNCGQWGVASNKRHCHGGGVAIKARSEEPDRPIIGTYQGLTVRAEQSGSYTRRKYNHWIDTDGDKEDARVEVLIAESLIPAQTKIKNGKVVVISGLWVCPYTGTVVTVPGELDVDHMVPLKEAHESGAYSWSKEKREAYANELTNPDHLIAVTSGSNRSKGAKDPAEWLPPNRAYWCEYIKDWIDIKKEYQLAIDQAERDALKKAKNVCSKYESGDSLGGRH